MQMDMAGKVVKSIPYNLKRKIMDGLKTEGVGNV